jgi:hypothetical protein
LFRGRGKKKLLGLVSALVVNISDYELMKDEMGQEVHDFRTQELLSNRATAEMSTNGLLHTYLARVRGPGFLSDPELIESTV